MKIIFIIALLGIISSSSTYFPIPTLYFNYDYVLDKTSISYAEYYFRAVVDKKKTMDFELVVKNKEFTENYFEIRVVGYSSSPSDDDIYHYSWGSISGLSARFYDKGEYKVIAYRYDASDYFNYLGIMVSYTSTRPSDFSYSYIVFRVDVTKYYYSNIKDLDYNTEYKFDVSIWDPPKVPYGYQVFVRIFVHPDDKMEIRLETQSSYDKNSAFKVDVCQFKEKPSESQVYYGSNSKVCKNGLSNDSSESKKYVYPFTTEEDINYLAISIINQLSDLNYLYIYIYSETGMAIAVLVVIIVIPCLVVIGVVVFLLKKFGCIGK